MLPLQHPIIDNDGQQISSILVRKGQIINISVAAYNRRVSSASIASSWPADVTRRNPAVWGADAAVWNPDRFAHMDKQSMVSLGPYANLGNFGAFFFPLATISLAYLCYLQPLVSVGVLGGALRASISSANSSFTRPYCAGSLRCKLLLRRLFCTLSSRYRRRRRRTWSVVSPACSWHPWPRDILAFGWG